MENLRTILAEAHDRLSANPTADLIDWLARQLGLSFDEAHATGTVPAFRDVCRQHPLSDLFLLDPYSRRAHDKPRGYAGDAVMLDYIYRPNSDDLDGLASIIHQATTTLPNAKSILWRRDYLANQIRRQMASRKTAEVLSVACGHMRELDALRLLTRDTNVRFTALDQDGASIAETKAEYHEFTIEGRLGSFVSLIRERPPFQPYDFIYSAGLFDYLPVPPAVSLITAMHKRLKTGGKLSVGNFTRDSHGRGFMAGFMDWTLIYRDESDMQALAEAACPGARYDIFRDDPGNVVYVEIHAA